MSVRLRAGLRFEAGGRHELIRVVAGRGGELPAGSAQSAAASAQLTLTVAPAVADGSWADVGPRLAPLAHGAPSPGLTHATLIEVTLRALADIEALGAVLDVPAPLDGRDLDLYGYQSWSMTGTFPAGAHPRSLAAPLRVTPFAAVGDLGMARDDRDLTAPTSHELLVACRPQRIGPDEAIAPPSADDDPDATWLAASLLGRDVFTLWQAMGAPGARFARGVLDVAGLRLAAGEERTIARVLVVSATGRVPALAAVRAWDGIEPRPAPRVTGWCSWYEHYQHIDEPTLDSALDEMARADWPAPAIFQVDDGYQRRVGDWLDLADAAFPRGMAPLAARAREAGLTPGIWVAPFVASRTSRLAREHPEWIARDAHGRRVVAGLNAAWGGVFDALDLTNPDVLAYLAHVLRVMREEWGYRFFKLDFLYAAALAPPPGLTRAQAMRRGMELLREWCGDAAILGCGVPLVSAAGLVEHCRIGADVAARWESPIEKASGSRERVSTFSSLSSTLTRFWLDGHCFSNDPDVIILRDWRTELTDDEINTLATVNALLGSLVFCSDDLARYDEFRWRALRRTWPLPAARVVSIEVDGAHRLILQESGVTYELAVNLTDGPRRLADGAVLPAHATRVIRLPAPSDPVLGSTGYVLPGGEVLAADRRGDELTLTLRPSFRGPSTVQLRPDASLRAVIVAGAEVPFSREATGRISVHLPQVAV